MSHKDQRRFPRIHHVSSKEIIHLDPSYSPKQNIIITENVSASGIKFTTNVEFAESQFFLIYLNDVLMKQIHQQHRDWVRSGDYYLTKVIRVKLLSEKSNVFEIGAAFIEKKDFNPEELDIFTELLNIRMLNHLPTGYFQFKPSAPST